MNPVSSRRELELIPRGIEIHLRGLPLPINVLPYTITWYRTSKHILQGSSYVLTVLHHFGNIDIFYLAVNMKLTF